MLLSCSCRSQDLSKIIHEFITRENDFPGVLRLIHENDTKSIPLLIDLIDIDKKGHIGFVNKFSSQLDLSTNYLGVNSAFMIELILSTKELKGPLIEYEGTSIKTPVEGISLGIIVKKNSSQSLSRDDMIELKGIYNEWWERKRNDSLEIIRSTWQSGDRPLADSGFVWR